MNEIKTGFMFKPAVVNSDQIFQPNTFGFIASKAVELDDLDTWIWIQGYCLYLLENRDYVFLCLAEEVVNLLLGIIGIAQAEIDAKQGEGA